MSENDVEAIDHLRDAYARLRKSWARSSSASATSSSGWRSACSPAGMRCLMGVPGLAKTLMVNKLAETMSLKFSRIQFTPDLMPMDITGTDILQETAGGRREFQFVHGPVFANIVLADEINRAPPKTQAAMLEAMQEQNVTVVGKVFHLEPPFLVLATQNPIEQEGTYPLPEAQLDRFMFLIELDYPIGGRGDPDRPHDDGRGAAAARSSDDAGARSSGIRTWCGACRCRTTFTPTRRGWCARRGRAARRRRRGSSRWFPGGPVRGRCST